MKLGPKSHRSAVGPGYDSREHHGRGLKRKGRVLVGWN